MTCVLQAISREPIKSSASEFDARRVELSIRCAEWIRHGETYKSVAIKLNSEGIKTKTGKLWSAANVHALVSRPAPPEPRVKKSGKSSTRNRGRKKGLHKQNDVNLSWVSEAYPHLEAWRILASEYLNSRESGLGHAIQGVNRFIEFIVKSDSPAPVEFLLNKTSIPDFYETIWGKKLTHSNILANNAAHAFLTWVLSTPAYCEEDDNGRLQTSPAFRNPIRRMSRSGIPQPFESVRSTLPYGYVDELRKMIAEGPNFKDWTWAQNALGASLSQIAKNKGQLPDLEDDLKVSNVWFEVHPDIIDYADPDCVWRSRSKRIESTRRSETIYEMWSPVRWVALLNKLQLPLRTFQVRMLDSGEADTWIWRSNEWQINKNSIVKGSIARPYSNGVFLRPNRLIDGEAKVLLHINTNKTADRERAGTAKGYNVPWIVGGPLHQDPFYWLEKLCRWQEKYNPLSELTKWSDLDGRHMSVKSDVQLANCPDTAFLFRVAESTDRRDLPINMSSLDRPWFLCLEELQKRLHRRGETMPNGDPIKLVPDVEHRVRGSNVTFFTLHSLRVSLITALAIDGQVPLAILQKIAGHSRLIMTLYYTKPGATQTREAIQAGVERLNNDADTTILDWLANAEYEQLVREAVANSPDTLKASIPESKHLRSPAGWMAMVDGLCLVGGNNVEPEANGCHNGGDNIGNETAPRYAPVLGGARNCPMCRWFITRPYFLPQLAARWNNVSYHCFDAREQVVLAEQRFREIEDLRASAIQSDTPFTEQRQYLEAQRALEHSVQKFDQLTQTLAATTRLMERCRSALSTGNGTSLVAVGGTGDFEFAMQETDSEMLQISGVCEGSALYFDLSPGKAVLRQSQLLDAALVRDNLRPAFLMLTEEEQQLVGNAFLRQLAAHANPSDPSLGRYQVISLIEAKQSLVENLGYVVEDSLRLASAHMPIEISSFKKTRIA